MDEVRYWIVKETASKHLDHPRESKFEYSNLGYVIAGAVLERMSGKTGSNGMNLAIAMFWPDKDFGFVMMTNVATKAADAAMQRLAVELYNRFSTSTARDGHLARAGLRTSEIAI
jgi:hypothetical protein